MRKISLVLAALMGLSGAAYGANWVEIGQGNGQTDWIAAAYTPKCVWTKAVLSSTKELRGEPFNEVVSLVRVNCAQGYVRPLQIDFYMDGQEISGGQYSQPRLYVRPGSALGLTFAAVCRKK